MNEPAHRAQEVIQCIGEQLFVDLVTEHDVRHERQFRGHRHLIGLPLSEQLQLDTLFGLRAVVDFVEVELRFVGTLLKGERNNRITLIQF